MPADLDGVAHHVRHDSAALTLAIAGPALAQSTLILPEPGGGYLVVPPSGRSTQVVPLPGGGAMA